jgi:hypothetical protein
VMGAAAVSFLALLTFRVKPASRRQPTADATL